MLVVPVIWWAGLLLGIGVLLAVDLFSHRREHAPSTTEAAVWVGFYCGCAVAFAVVVGLGFGHEYGGQFLAGWLTEYSLSIDNLFVFMVLMTRFAVPEQLQLRVLTIGIVLALVLRGGLIAVGAAAVARFSWLFLIFGGFLLWTAWSLLRGDSHPTTGGRRDPATAGRSVADVPTRDGVPAAGDKGRLIRLLERVLPTTSTWHGTKLWAHERNRLVITPLLLTMVTIGFTDVLFALDSIPAIFGMTKEPYLVIAANAFALLGLRQLYFLVGGLLDRLVHLSKGLSVVLAFIGLKLISEALHENSVSWINGGRPVRWAPEIPVLASLAVVLGTLVITAMASLYTARRQSGRGTRPGPPATTDSNDDRRQAPSPAAAHRGD